MDVQERNLLSAVFTVFGIVNVLQQRQKARRRRLLAIKATYLMKKRTRPYNTKEYWVFPMNNMFWEKSVPLMSDARFRTKFRISRTTFQYLVSNLEKVLSKEDTHMRKSIPVDKRVAIAIHCLKSGSDFDTVATAYGVGISTVCVILREFCKALDQALGSRHVTLPTQDTDLDAVVNGFFQRWNFPNTVGALDSTHIPIQSPKEYPEDYFNYKGWKSIHCLALVDHLYRFRYVRIGDPGKNNDSTVFARCSLSKTQAKNKLFPVGSDYHIISDGAFALSDWIMKPFPEFRGITEIEENFNYRLSRARMVVECAFGRLKARWRILQKRCDIKTSDVQSIVKACVILHNLCEDNRENVDSSWIREMQLDYADFPQPPTEQNIAETRPGRHKRNEMAASLFQDGFVRMD